MPILKEWNLDHNSFLPLLRLRIFFLLLGNNENENKGKTTSMRVLESQRLFQHSNYIVQRIPLLKSNKFISFEKYWFIWVEKGLLNAKLVKKKISYFLLDNVQLIPKRKKTRHIANVLIKGYTWRFNSSSTPNVEDNSSSAAMVFFFSFFFLNWSFFWVSLSEWSWPLFTFPELGIFPWQLKYKIYIKMHQGKNYSHYKANKLKNSHKILSTFTLIWLYK